MNTTIAVASDILEKGGVGIFPTDTAFGIGCRIDRPEAIKRLFAVRKRPLNNPTPVLFANLESVKEYTIGIPKEVEDELIKKYWPGALTIILKANLEKVPELVRGGITIGTRIPGHKTTLSLLSEVKVPIIGTSANFHGLPTPYKFKDLDKKLLSLVDFVIEGETSLQKESTVIDCSHKPWKILREGAIKLTNEK